MTYQFHSEGSKGEFFGFSIAFTNKLLENGAGAEEVMAYLVLARGVSHQNIKRLSTHGANSIAIRTGLGYRRAEAALEWLQSVDFINKEVVMTNSPRPSNQRAKWRINTLLEHIDTYLANSFIDGIGEGKNNPPLSRIYSQVSLGASGIMAASRLDTLMVLLTLYKYQDMPSCGGIDPRKGIYIEITPAENSIGDTKTDIEGTSAALYEVEVNASTVYIAFAGEALWYVPEVDRMTRFWDAFNNLKRMGFLYSVTQVWDRNPNSNKGRQAEPLYTLYVHDYHARQSDPYLQREIHEAAFRLGAMGRAHAFDESSDADVFSGRFRYIAHREHGGFPIGIYRLRFRPKTRDTGIGMDMEAKRVAEWARFLDQLR